MQYFHGTKIDFISKRNIFFTVSAILITVGIIATGILGPVLGIDFTGGTQIDLKFKQTVQIEDIRSAVEGEGLTGSEIKTSGSDNSFLIRVKGVKDAPVLVKEALTAQFGTDSYELLKSDEVGAKIGKELWLDAILAVLLAVVGILIYIAFRFEFVFGLGAVAALIHDVLITFSGIVIFHHLGLINLEIDQAILAGLLTVVGYSINDTVIIFDRIRENKENIKGKPLVYLVNTSINETLSRTVNTVATTLIVLITLLFFGGSALQGFAFTMLIGITTGTYSSIFIASSFVVFYNEKVKKVDVKGGTNAAVV